MTEHKSFKRLVRARMAKTGESYTAARAMLLRAEEPEDVVGVRLSTSDEKIRERTGRGWEEWFELLDEWGAADRTHREIARWVAEQQGVVPLAWNAQAVAASYELSRGLRTVGEKEDGFAITASKTVAVPVERLYDAFVGEAGREHWLPAAGLTERTATRPKSARFDWDGGDTRVNVTFLPKGESRSTVALEHRRLPDAGEAERMKGYWRQGLASLKELLER
jgi:Activator of Hsp90 ATPase homolog 1-like protein